MDFGATLKRLRQEKGLSQFDFANRIDVHSQTVSKWERDISLPDFSMLSMIAKNLDIPFDRLFGIENALSVDGNFDNVKMGEGIRLKRKEKGISQAEFGALIGVTADIVSKWERGYVCPDLDRFKSVCDYFEVLPSELYYANFKSKEIKVNVSDDVATITDKREKRKYGFIVVAIALLTVVVIMLSVIVLIPNCKGEDLTEPPAEEPLEEPAFVEVGFVHAVDNPVILRGENETVYWCELHGRYCTTNGGYDYAAQIGQTVYAVTSGKVSEIIEPSAAFANGIDNVGVEVVIERADGIRARYWSLKLKDGIEIGTEIEKGQEIGFVANHHRARCQRDDGGSVHVHIEKDGETINLKDKIKESE